MIFALIQKGTREQQYLHVCLIFSKVMSNISDPHILPIPISVSKHHRDRVIEPSIEVLHKHQMRLTHKKSVFIKKK